MVIDSPFLSITLSSTNIEDKMKRADHLFERLIDFYTLRRAAQRAWRGRQNKRGFDALSFMYHLEERVIQLQDEISSGSWRPSSLTHFIIRDPKLRRISAAPFKDRVVHHALCEVMSPRLNTYQVEQSYACRVNKGLHRAIDRAQRYARSYPYVLRLDIAHYFESLPHDRLMTLLSRLFKEPNLLKMLEYIVYQGVPQSEVGVGVPIGSLMSQHFANLYLTPLDHWIKRTLKVKGYLRYMDDFVLMGREKEELWRWRDEVELFLRERGLSLKPQATHLCACHAGFSFLGFRIWPHYVRLDGARRRRLIRRIKELHSSYERCSVDDDLLRRKSESIHQWVSTADSYRLRCSIWERRAWGEDLYLG